jgi:acetyltransferase-like isoleucine patch superfamily enzyme
MKLYERIRQKLGNYRFKRMGVKMHSSATIHHSVDIYNGKNVTVGENSILYKEISVYPNASGCFKLGNNSHIAPFGYLLIDKNNLTIGDDVAIGPFCTFVCHSNSFEGKDKLFRKNYLDGDITIGNNVFMGAQCTVLPGTIIEDNVVVASNSVVKGLLESGSVYGGSPAKKIKSI